MVIFVLCCGTFVNYEFLFNSILFFSSTHAQRPLDGVYTRSKHWSAAASFQFKNVKCQTRKGKVEKLFLRKGKRLRHLPNRKWRHDILWLSRVVSIAARCGFFSLVCSACVFFRWQQLHCDDMARLFIVCLCSLHTFVWVWILTAVAEWLLMLLLRIVFFRFCFGSFFSSHLPRAETWNGISGLVTHCQCERNANTWNEHTHTECNELCDANIYFVHTSWHRRIRTSSTISQFWSDMGKLSVSGCVWVWMCNRNDVFLFVSHFLCISNLFIISVVAGIGHIQRVRERERQREWEHFFCVCVSFLHILKCNFGALVKWTNWLAIAT